MKTALIATELLGKPLEATGHDWHGAFPILDNAGVVVDIVDGDNYSHITRTTWDVLEYHWTGEAYVPVDLDNIKRTPPDVLWDDYVGEQTPREFWQLALDESPSITPEQACMEYMVFRQAEYPHAITADEARAIAEKLTEYLRETLGL